MHLLALLSAYSCVLVATAQSTTPTAPENDDVYDVIIVGAGLTGLSAARELKALQPNARVKLLEAKDEVGGRIRATAMKTAEGEAPMDMGSHFVSPSANAMITLIKELGLSLFAQTNCGLRSLDIRQKRGANTDMLRTRRSFAEVLNSTELDSWATQTVHEYLVTTGQTKPSMDTANRLLQTLFDSPDNRASILQLFLASASENATVSDLLSRYGHGQGLLLQGGLSRLVKALAENQDIQLGEEVTAIEEAGSLVVLKTTNGSYSAKQVIVTVPPSLTTSIVFTPPLPIEYEEFIESYKPTGRAFYFTMTFASPFWRGNGKNGQIIHTNPHGPILWLTTFDVGSPTMCSGQGQTGVLWGIAHPVDDSDSDSQARLASYTQIVMRSLGDNGTEPLDVREEHFSKDPYSRGSIAVLPPRVTVDGLRYLQGVNFHGKRVVFASAEYSNSSMGLMNGAVLSGQKAGAIVGLRLRSAEEPDREGNDIANMIRLNDEILQTQRPQEESVEPKQTLSDVQSEEFVYNTSTQYPSTTPFESTTYKHFSFDNVNDDKSSTSSNEIQHEASGMEADQEANEASGENAGVISSSERSSFVYKTSTQYPPTTPFETSTLQHFSFGNAPTVEPFVPHPPSTDVSVSTAPPTTTTVRTTFTTPDPLRTTTPFMYSTSTIDPPFEPLETTTFKHFSFGNDENALPTMQKDPTSSAPKEELINRLRNIAQKAPNYSTIQLATKLSALVENLLLSMQEEQNARRI